MKSHIIQWFSVLLFVMLMMSSLVFAQTVISPSGGRMPTATTSPPLTHAPGSTVCCTQGVYGHPDATCFSTINAQQCRLQGGAIQHCTPFDNDTSVSSGTLIPIPVGVNPEDHPSLATLPQDIAESGVASMTYTPVTNDCDDFATDLEQFLEWQKGYNAGYAHFVVYDEITQEPLYAHTAVTVLIDGALGAVFIEPQTGRYISLDFDDNLFFTVFASPFPYIQGYWPTEPNVKISFYDNQAFANAAGVPSD